MADGASSMLDVVQGRETTVRGTISKGRYVQGAQHPKIFGRGFIGRGHINPASSGIGLPMVRECVVVDSGVDMR